MDFEAIAKELNFGNAAAVEQALLDVNVFFASRSPSTALDAAGRKFADVVSVPEVVALLSRGGDVLTERCCELLAALLNDLTAEEVLRSFGAVLLQGLDMGSRGGAGAGERVETLCATQLLRGGSSEACVRVVVELDVLPAVLTHLARTSSTGVALLLSKLVYAVASATDGLPHVFSGARLDAFSAAAAGSAPAVTRFRAYELATRVACMSPAGLEHVTDARLLDCMVADVESDDVLVQSNVVEMLCQLMIDGGDGGADFARRTGLLEKLISLLVRSTSADERDRNPLADSLLCPFILRFLGRVCAVPSTRWRELCMRYPVLPYLRATLAGEREGGGGVDEALLSNAIETVGKVAAYWPDGLGVLLEDVAAKAQSGQAETPVAALLLAYVAAGKERLAVQPRAAVVPPRGVDATVMRVGAMHSIALMLETVPASDEQATRATRDFCTLLRHVVPALGGGGGVDDRVGDAALARLLQLCVEFAGNPFVDLKHAAFRLIRAFCMHAWGRTLVAQTAGTLEYLLDRSTEHEAAALQWKFAIVETLARGSPAFSPESKHVIDKYVRDGALVVVSETAVAFESA